MTDKNITALYICYWSLLDPLCQSQSLAYLLQLTARGRRFALITFEQEKYALQASPFAAMKRQLAEQGILWFPLTYHKRWPLLATAYDCLRGILMGLWIALRHRPKVVHSRSSIAAAMALGIAFIGRLKFLYDADARLSEEYADNGHWSRDSRAFRVTAWVEAQARKRADAIIVLSETLRDDFRREFQVNAPIEVIPCCVNLQVFQFNQASRERCRRELGVGDEKVFVYVGKTGARYQVAEMFEFFRVAQARSGGARLLILSGDDPEAFHRIAAGVGISHNRYWVQYARHEKVGEYLSACDAGLAFIRSAGCERGSSPIKIGEYLAAGLPVVITDSIGDYSRWIAQHQMGAVLAELHAAHYEAALDQLTKMWACKDGRAERHQFAATHLALETVGAKRYGQVYDVLLRDEQFTAKLQGSEQQ
ncbi:MAG: glycosyltransferase [Acidobacteria bacterium]|nr:glycosyltransferase [Acidobacteriota bacterium]